MPEIVVATRNAHKLAEIGEILAPVLPGVQLLPDTAPAPAETGTSFIENALIKARTAASHTGKLALADDSGISVEVMGSSPGIFSARWAGPDRSDRDNLELLLWQMRDVPENARAASFVCAAVAVLPLPGGGFAERTALAHWHGTLLAAPQGEQGFGYDPIFQPAGHTCSAAELTAVEKNALSHRFRAFSELAPQLPELLAS
ncbi:MAG: RdgB/HAM1 family non-canonical purine NTP pyrophosphatase [Microbacteriaceae bacterium]|nr:RdgB/HAM1 family non-canonical purine NTP pyrophosphatase [Microbacteriaceae bacterium]